MIRVIVTGTSGQLATCLSEAADARFDLVTCGRPALDFAAPQSIAAAIARLKPDVVVNAAAYTAVDKAETEPDVALTLNAIAAGEVARAAASANAPVIHISTDYVFDGSKATAYVESDSVGPTSAYGRSKLEGERLVAAAAPRHVILRTAWVHSPFGNNFIKTMLRLAGTRSEIGVVGDQHGSPTYAPHLAAGILDIVDQVARGAHASPWGVYHAAGTGTASWADVARAAFAASARRGGPAASVRAITTAEYPTPAKRPANSRLDCSKLDATFGVSLPDWREGVEACVARLVEDMNVSNGTARDATA